MAKINGVEVRSLKTFTGHDGSGYLQGNIYFKGKKLGFWSQDAWCGPDIFDFDKDILKQAVIDFKNGFPDDYHYKKYMDQPEMLIFSVITLKRKEKFVRPTLKKGFTVLLVSDEISKVSMPVSSDMADEEILSVHAEDIEDMKRHCSSDNPLVEIIHSLDYFNIKVDKDHPALLYPC